MAETLHLEPLTAKAFEPFGRVLQTQGHSGQSINYGHTLKFADLASPVLGGKGKAVMSIYRSRPVELPFPVSELERHLGLSQAFMPLEPRAFPIVVADGDDRPNHPRAFLSNGKQGICLHPGTWHHHLLTLEEICEFLVLESRDNETSTQIHSLGHEMLLQR